MIDFKFYQHQTDDIKRFAHQKHAAFFWGVGSGKSLGAIGLLRAKSKLNKRLLRSLIICPPNILDTFYFELEKFLPEKSFEKVIKIKGSIKERLESIEDNYKKGMRIFLLSDSTFSDSIQTNKMIYAFFKEIDFDMIIVDESHRYKSTSSLRTKALSKLGRIYEDSHKLIMTGTSVLNSYADLYSQFLFLSGKYLGENKTIFNKSFTVPVKHQFYKKNGFGEAALNTVIKNEVTPIHKKIIKERIKDAVSIRETKDLVDLPDFILKPIYFDADKKQLVIYNSLLRDMAALFEKEGDIKTISVSNVLTKTLRLCQISSGYIEGDDDKDLVKFDARRKALSDLLDLIDLEHEKIIIWACFKDNYKDIKEVLKSRKEKYATLFGGMTDKKKQKAIDDFKNKKDVKYLISNPSSGGTGLNLQESDASIYYSKNYSLGDYLQSKARNYRAGSKNLHTKVVHYHLICKGLVDEVIMDALQKKSSELNSLREGIIKHLGDSNGENK